MILSVSFVLGLVLAWFLEEDQLPYGVQESGQ